MNEAIRVGLLPLYIQLYDEAVPELLPRILPFLELVEKKLKSEGLEVDVAPICRVRSHFEAAIAGFDRANVDVIVTLHLAYSPSLEAADALIASDKPVIMLDTTPDADFGLSADPDQVLTNHGIHGLQDLANRLRRGRKKYWVVAGHVSDAAVTRRVADLAHFAAGARHFLGSRALRIGPVFAGMGDFQVEESLLQERFRIAVETVDRSEVAAHVAAVTDGAIEAERQRDTEVFSLDAGDDLHRANLRVGLGLRRTLEARGAQAFSLNFDGFASKEGPLATMPFLECCKAMQRGIGYAGEGDVLTASLVGGLLRACPQTSFTEMFCADWTGGAVYLSHMGEFNPALTGPKPRVCEKPYPFEAACNPVTIACAPTPGPATLVNIAPGPDDRFELIAAPVEVLGDSVHPQMRNAIRGWLRPEVPVAEFLERYSNLGGTHHAALVSGVHLEGLKVFAEIAGLDAYHVIR